MNKKKVSVKWINHQHFQAVLDSRFIPLDSKDPEDSTNQGMRPKALLLVALAGCTGVDISHALSEMKVAYDTLEIDVEATLSQTTPSVYLDFDVTYVLSGKEIDTTKVVKAIYLSLQTYCGVALMLHKVGPITPHVIVNGVTLELDRFDRPDPKG